MISAELKTNIFFSLNLMTYKNNSIRSGKFSLKTCEIHVLCLQGQFYNGPHTSCHSQTGVIPLAIDMSTLKTSYLLGNCFCLCRALDGGSPCGLSILRNGNVTCHYFRNLSVNFKIAQCHLSILRNRNVPCRYFINFPVDFKRAMSPVEFKKR